MPMRLFLRLPVTVLGDDSKTPVPNANPILSAPRRYPVSIGATTPKVMSSALAKSVLLKNRVVWVWYCLKFTIKY